MKMDVLVNGIKVSVERSNDVDYIDAYGKEVYVVQEYGLYEFEIGLITYDDSGKLVPVEILYDISTDLFDYSELPAMENTLDNFFSALLHFCRAAY